MKHTTKTQDKYRVGQLVRVVRVAHMAEALGKVVMIMAKRRRCKYLELRWLGYRTDFRDHEATFYPPEEFLEPIGDSDLDEMRSKKPRSLGKRQAQVAGLLASIFKEPAHADGRHA